MLIQSIPHPKFRAERYRELALQALRSVTEYTTEARRHAQRGASQMAAEYQELASGAAARAERYRTLAGFAERTSLAAHG